MMKKRITISLILLFVFFAFQGARDTVQRIVFPDHEISFDPLKLFGVRMEASYVPGIVKSIQYGAAALAGTSATATITAVTTANATVLWLGDNASTVTPAQNQAQTRVSLTNPTTVTATSAGSVSSSVGFVVLEFRSGIVRSVNQYTLTSSGTSTAKTITSVAVAKALVVNQGMTSSSGNTTLDANCMRPLYTLTNATTVTVTLNIYNPGGCGVPTSAFAVLEFVN